MSGGSVLQGLPGVSAAVGVRYEIVSLLGSVSTRAPQKSQKLEEGSIVLLQLEQVIWVIPFGGPETGCWCFLRHLMNTRFSDHAVDDCVCTLVDLCCAVLLECGQACGHDRALGGNDSDTIVDRALKAGDIRRI